MKPPVFSYARPATLDQALAMLREGDDVRALAGGQSLMPMLNFRLAKPTHLVDINALKELDFVEESQGTLRIGALTRHRTLLSNPRIKRLAPLMAGAAEFIGHPAIRNRGTIGGSLSHADPAAELPIIVTALDAKLVLQSKAGKRTLGPEEFFAGPLITNRRPDELLTEVVVPLPPPGTGWGFHEVARRHGDFALVAVAAVLTLDRERRITKASIAIGGIGDRPLRLRACETELIGRGSSSADLRAASADAAAGIEANADIHASAAYRRHLARALVFRALADAADRALAPEVR